MDWKKIIAEILDSGLSQADIAASVGIAQPSVSDLATGATKEPRWGVGDRLIALHRNRVPKEEVA